MSKMSEIHAFIEDRLYETGEYDRIADELAREYNIPFAESLRWVYDVAKYMDEQSWQGGYDDEYVE